ncbi:hypothetical protein SAMN05216588_103286 [Pseudomonas flavescens]|uniref:Uncharacterized protein n=1 Tax=Phytopseudomonas flavescens TaxID=29435 RepID=A0A1G8ARB2_9GAMM|nr:hypothetical protein [Pseudomonas flavescens]SDH23602.1 hypothetical protein SAMN05216588_103286 [Pseudomonas flavescens]
MSEWLDDLYGCCEGVLRGDRQLIAQLRAAGFDCDEEGWSFHLPALHAWLAARAASQPAGDYPSFLRCLYASDLNTRLARQGARIAIADNRGKLSESLYRLQRLP